MKDTFLANKRISLVLVVVLLISVVKTISYAQGRPKIYWTEGRSIKRANLDGSNVEVILSELGWTRDFALDLTNEKMYWIEYYKARIQYANLDGTNIKNVTTGFRLMGGGTMQYSCKNGKCEGVANPHGGEPILLTHDMLNIPSCLAIDSSSNRLYWGNNERWVIQHSDLDGSNIDDVLIEKLFNQQDRIKRAVYAESLELDMNVGKLYFVDAIEENIARANLNGTNYENLDISLADPKALALDLHNRKLYWTHSVLGEISRANLDGTHVETILTGLDKLGAICLDVSSNKMYWVESSAKARESKIRQANLDGSDITDIIKGDNTIHGITIDTEGVTTVTPNPNKLTTTWANMKTVE